MGYPLINVASKKKIDANILRPKNMPPNLIDIVEDKHKGGWAKGLADESRDRETPLQTKKKMGMREGRDPSPVNEKKRHDLPAILWSMHLVMECPGNGMIPGQLFRQTSQLVGIAATEQGGQTGFPQGKMPHSLEQVKENRERYRVENESFKRVDHL